jgi:hypothetical protein
MRGVRGSSPVGSRLLSALGLVLLLLVGAGTIARASGTDDPPTPEPAPAPAAVITGGEAGAESELREGDTIGQGTREGDRCIFSQPVGVTMVVTGSESPRVEWMVDDACRMVITHIGPNDGAGAPLPGIIVEPTDASP